MLKSCYYNQKGNAKVLLIIIMVALLTGSIFLIPKLNKDTNEENIDQNTVQKETTTQTENLDIDQESSVTREEIDELLKNFQRIPNPNISEQTEGSNTISYITSTYPPIGSFEELTVTKKLSFPEQSITWRTLSMKDSSINDLSDIDIEDPDDRDILRYDSDSKTWEAESLYGRGKEVSQEDFVIYINSNKCYAYETMTGETKYSGENCSQVIQNTINKAGENGSISFKAGTYILDTELSPMSRQTWQLVQGAIFKPQGNNRIINISGIDEITFHGTLTIQDPESKTTSVEAIKIDDMSKSYFEHISIVNYYRGISISGTNGGANENDFVTLYMQVRDRGLSLETSSHDNHFYHIWIKGPSPTQWSTGAGIYIATGGTQGGNTFDHVEILDMNIGLELPGAFEAWFGNVIVDNPYGVGVSIGGSCERLFFDTLWTSSGGDGVIIKGDQTSYADKIQIGKLYSWLNGNYGVRIDGYVENLTIGTVVVQRNTKGFVISGIQNREINISSLTSYENIELGVDGSGITRNAFLDNAIIYDTALGLDYFTHIGGVRVGVGLFESNGIAQIQSGDTSVVVEHGLEGTPSFVGLSPFSSELVGAYISARNSTTFTITVSSAVTGDREIGWNAKSGRQLEPELLSNSSVDEEEDGDPVDWNKSADGTSYSDTEYSSGTYSLQIDVSSETADWRSDSFLVNEDRTHRVRASVKGTGSSEIFLTIRWFSNVDGTGFISENNIDLNTTYADWTEIKEDLLAPGGAQSADLLFRAAGSTTANIYADEFSVREVR